MATVHNHMAKVHNNRVTTVIHKILKYYRLAKEVTRDYNHFLMSEIMSRIDNKKVCTIFCLFVSFHFMANSNDFITRWDVRESNYDSDDETDEELDDDDPENVKSDICVFDTCCHYLVESGKLDMFKCFVESLYCLNEANFIPTRIMWHTAQLGQTESLRVLHQYGYKLWDCEFAALHMTNRDGILSRQHVECVMYICNSQDCEPESDIILLDHWIDAFSRSALVMEHTADDEIEAIEANYKYRWLCAYILWTNHKPLPPRNMEWFRCRRVNRERSKVFWTCVKMLVQSHSIIRYVQKRIQFHCICNTINEFGNFGLNNDVRDLIINHCVKS